MSVVRPTGKIEFPTTATTSMLRNLLTRLLSKSRSFNIARRRQIKQVPLALPFDNSFTPFSVHPTFLPSELFEGRSVFLLKFFKRVRSRFQHALEFCDLLLRLNNTSFSPRGLAGRAGHHPGQQRLLPGAQPCS